MPYKSKAQARAMNAKCSRGEIPQGVCDEFNASTKGHFSELPERVRKPAHKRTGRTVTRKKG